MKNLAKTRHMGIQLGIWCVSLFILTLALLEFAPLFVALRAGIAGLSIFVFGPLVLVALWLAFSAWREKLGRPALIALSAAIIALIALVVPVIAYTSVAREQAVTLRFNPLRYASFTGDSIAPTKTVTYKSAADQELKLALYQADTSVARPAVLLIHAGGWQYGDYLRTNNWPKLFRDAGYQVVSIQYRLANEKTPTWDKAPADVSDAVEYVKAHALELGINPSKLAIFGQSAGGHLALLEANRSSATQAAIGLYAPTDLGADYEQSIDKESELAFLGGTPEEQVERYQATSVPQAVTPLSPPTLLIQGTNDDIVNHRSATMLSEQFTIFDVKHRLVLIPYAGHSFDNQVGGFATQIAEQVVLKFLSSTIGR